MKLAALRVDGERRAVMVWSMWYALTVLIVLMVPAYVRFERPIWALAPIRLPQALAVTAAYLAFALFLRLGASQGWVSRIGAFVVCFGAAVLFLHTGNDIEYSRILVAFAAVLSLALSVVPYVVGTVPTLVGATFAIGGLGMAAGRLFSRDIVDRQAAGPEVILTALHSASITHFRGLVGPTLSNGGAIAAYGAGFLLVTGSGEFYRLDWKGRDSLRSRRLALSAPENYQAFLSDFQFEEGVPRLRDRVTDLLVDTARKPVRLFLAHQHWNREKRCFTMRASSIDVSLEGERATPASEWGTVFETMPCLVPGPDYDDSETGGRLAWGPGRQLLMTVGEHGLSGRSARNPKLSLAQRQDADYGKILLLDGNRGRKVFSLGHRNPQGLTVDRSGHIWSTEHGPEGGDELNLIVEHGNYGWPLATYGTEYGLDYWPFAAGLNHGDFREPALAFVPSVGISNLIQIGPRQFPRWDGDLLIGSLRRKTLFRVRLRGDRVIYQEPIPIDREIRDLDEAPDGRIVMWNDEEREVTTLSRATVPPTGEAVFNARCFGCHVPMRGSANAVGPSLREIIGRRVASQPGFPYSSALRRLGGTWTSERLEEFLRDPGAYAPGSAMEIGRVVDPGRRRAVIDYLARYK